jgi:SAM-dependent methyltransferase
MHKSALLNAKRFHDTYLSGQRPQVIEIGSQVVAGQDSLRGVFADASQYTGLDFAQGPGVDVVLEDPYRLPLADQVADVVLSSSCFEHAEFFWLSFLEMCRISKPDGLLYLNSPSNGFFHRYPVDCWRFYPDSGLALQNWGRRNGYDITLLESYISHQDEDMWNDFVAVFGLGDRSAERHPQRITSSFTDFNNGYVAGAAAFLNPAQATEDQARRNAAELISNGKIRLTW